jgi:hypothetical protein
MSFPKRERRRLLGKYGICLFLAISVLSLLSLTASALIIESFLSGEVSIVLDNGLWRKSQETIRFEDIQLDFDCQKSICSKQVWGYATNFNQADHEGKLLKVNQHGNPIQFQVQMHLNRDKWSQEGEADYFIELKRNGNKLEGKYSGTHNGKTVEGQVWGIVQNQLRTSPNFVPVQPGEHPRLLFRQQDIARLRSQAQTLMGQQIVVNLIDALATRPDRDFPTNDAIAYGLLYQLTDNADYAASAREILASAMNTPEKDVHGRAKTLLAAAYAYDLIYHTCDEAMRQRVNNWFDYNAEILLMGTDRDDFNPTPWSNWNGLYRSALGAIALTLLGEPGNYPSPPIPPIMMHLHAPKHFTPGKGVPIDVLEPGKMPTAWIFADSLEREMAEDPLASIGGIQKAQPEVGTTFTYRNNTRTFQPLDQKFIWNDSKFTQGRNMLDLASPVSGNYHTTAYYYTVVENQQPSWFKVGIRTTYGDGMIYLAGQRLTEGDFVYLEKGRYPILIEAAIAQRSGWREDSAKNAIEPRFISTTEEEAKAAYTKRYQSYKAALARWKEGNDTYKASGRINPNAPRLAKIAQRNIQRFINNALGDWGWNSEGESYTQWTMDLVLRYAHAYRNVMGIDLVQEPNLGRFLPLYVAKTIYGSQPYMDTFGGGDETAGLDLFAQGFTTVTEEYKPAVLWAWNHLLAQSGNNINAMTASFTLVNYPLDMKQKNPEQILPKAIGDRQKGGYVFRDRWQNQNDIVAQVFLKSKPLRATWWYVGDGALRIYGLGHPWVIKGATNKYQASDRKFENVVQITDNINGWLGAKTTDFQSQDNGSGRISMNLNDTYLARQKEENRELPLVDYSGHLLQENTLDLGIRGMRYFATDYSGVSGSPALFVVVDKLTGGGEKVWQMLVAQEHQISISGKSFTITASDGTSLKGTFVTPKNVALYPLEERKIEYKNLRGEAVLETLKLNGIQAKGGDSFFVVMTLQTGAAPNVEIKGEGLDAKVKVGEQMISLDKKINLTK